MTSTTPSYLKRAGHGDAEGLCTMENGAEASTAVFCSCACIRAGSSLFSLPPVLRKSKCVRSFFIPPSLYPTRFLYVLSSFLSLLSVSFLLCFVSNAPAVFFLSYLLHLSQLFSLHAHTPNLFVDSETS